MELLQFPSSPLLLTFLFLLFWVMTRPNPRNSRTKLPPSPWKLPIIGNIHQMLGGLPHHIFRDLSRKHGSDLMHLKLGQIDVIVVSSADAAGEIVKAQDLNFSSRSDSIATAIFSYGNKDIIFAPYGSYWREIRKICVLELLSMRRIKAFSTLREEAISELVNYISTSCSKANYSPINLSQKLLSLTNSIITRAAFGAKCTREESFISLMKKALEVGSEFNLSALYPSLSFLSYLSGVRPRTEKIHYELDEIFEEMIKEHQMKKEAIKKTRLEDDRQQEEEDLVDVLLRVKEKGDLEFPLTITNIKAVILDMFVAGTDTTSTTLVWAMVELVRHPKVMKKVQSEVRQALKGKAKIEDQDMIELHYMKLVIKETLRLHPPAPLLGTRVCAKTCQVLGYEISAGSRVVINAWAIGRDPRYWEDGECFNPDRFDGSSIDFKGNSFEYLPFSGGRRMCPGIAFGTAIIELTLANLLFHFDWKLPDGIKAEDIDMSEVFGITTTKKSDLWLAVEPLL